MRVRELSSFAGQRRVHVDATVVERILLLSATVLRFVVGRVQEAKHIAPSCIQHGLDDGGL